MDATFSQWNLYNGPTPRRTPHASGRRCDVSLVAMPGQHGNLPHATTRFTGTRFSLIFFICANFPLLGRFLDQVAAQIQRVGGLGFGVARLMVMWHNHDGQPPPTPLPPVPVTHRFVLWFLTPARAWVVRPA